MFLRECTTKQFLDFVELCFQTEHYPRIGSDDSNVIDAINEIFLNENSPYRMTSFVRKEEVEDVFIYGNRQRRTVVRIIHYPQVIYTEDEVVYREALAPALTALSRAEFTVADGEFRTGLEHYREGRYGDFLSNCSSALESVLKVICDKHNIQFDSNSALSTLLETVAAGLGLEAVYAEKFKLLATIRNRLSSSHGGGSQPRDPEPPYARLMLNLAAAAMVFLVETSDSK